MLQKSPGIAIIITIISMIIIIITNLDKRPTVQELYETRFVKRYLHDNLSYTIIDSNNNNNREPVTIFNRAKEIEKLRKFRQDMLRKKGELIIILILIILKLFNFMARSIILRQGNSLDMVVTFGIQLHLQI